MFYIFQFGENLKSIVILSKYFPNSDWHTHNSPKPVTDDQIWKNFVYNEEMTSKMQTYRLRLRYREDLGTRLGCCGKKMADISLVLRVRTSAGTRRNNRQKYGKNSKKTTGGRHLLFGEYLRSWTISKMNLHVTSMQVSMF